MKSLFLILGLSAALTADAYSQALVSGTNCINYPAFPKTFGFEPSKSLLSTSEMRIKGLVLVQPGQTQAEEKTFQDPSWKTAGALGTLSFDNQGNVFTYPVPHVNLIDNPPARSDILYRIDGVSGVMKEWMTLPPPTTIEEANPFGIMGLTYSCLNSTLYVSSIRGSWKDREAGRIYVIDPKSGAIQDKLENFDGFGLATAIVNGKHLLLAGNVRNSNVYSIELNEKGGFASAPKVIFSIAGRGPRGDDKARKIVIDEREQSLLVTGAEFNFNLASTFQREESVYRLKIR